MTVVSEHHPAPPVHAAAPDCRADPVTLAYLADSAAYADLEGAAQLALPPAYAAAFDQLLLARPLFVDEEEITSFTADVRAVYRLVESLAGRCFDGNAKRYCAALGMDERLAELLCLGETDSRELYARADAYHDGTGFRLLELNVGSELGGTDSAQLNRACLTVPAFRAFAEQNALTYVDTSSLLASALRRAAEPVAGGREPCVALVESPGGLSAHEPVFRAIQEALSGHGVELLLAEVPQVTARNGRLAVGGQPLDVVLRYFTAGELLDSPSGRDTVELFTRAHRDRRTILFTPLDDGLLESKANLALLHDPALRERFTPEELQVVDRVVPWTRSIGAATRHAPTDRAALLERCRADRERLVLKPGCGCGGVGVVLGRELTDREWSETLIALRDQDHVVQEVVTPACELVLEPTRGRLEPWHATWGVFATETDGYAGAFARALRPADGAVISYGNPQTRGACVFTVPANAPVGGAR